jgi:hypothetical protein
VQTLPRQYPLGPASDGLPSPALAIADDGRDSAVNTAAACQRAGIDYIIGIRLRVVPHRAYCASGERAGGLILLVMDELCDGSLE